ncbi:MAG: hypothetical protein J0M23_06825 [Rickettsiales bacterium]|nr:hypothetical protein [Rickettsiales bacterium]
MNTLSSNNDNTTIIILDGIEPLITPSSKLQKTLYKVGSSLKIKRSRSVNIEIGYDFGKSKKYHSHTGYVSYTSFLVKVDIYNFKSMVLV